MKEHKKRKKMKKNVNDIKPILTLYNTSILKIPSRLIFIRTFCCSGEILGFHNFIHNIMTTASINISHWVR